MRNPIETTAQNLNLTQRTLRNLRLISHYKRVSVFSTGCDCQYGHDSNNNTMLTNFKTTTFEISNEFSV